MTYTPKTHITKGTHANMQRLGWEAYESGAESPEPIINAALVAILSPEAIAEMKDSFAEGFYMAAKIKASAS